MELWKEGDKSYDEDHFLNDWHCQSSMSIAKVSILLSDRGVPQSLASEVVLAHGAAVRYVASPSVIHPNHHLKISQAELHHHWKALLLATVVIEQPWCPFTRLENLYPCQILTKILMVKMWESTWKRHAWSAISTPKVLKLWLNRWTTYSPCWRIGNTISR